MCVWHQEEGVFLRVKRRVKREDTAGTSEYTQMVSMEVRGVIRNVPNNSEMRFHFLQRHTPGGVAR